MTKIAIAGTGYVGMSIATLLAQHNEVISVDIDAERVNKVNRRESTIQDDYIERFFSRIWHYNKVKRKWILSFNNH